VDCVTQLLVNRKVTVSQNLSQNQMNLCHVGLFHLKTFLVSGIAVLGNLEGASICFLPLSEIAVLRPSDIDVLDDS
jgi:hypothetical protein